MRLFDNFTDGLKSSKQKVLEENQTLKELREQTEFEKGDLLALIIAAVTTLLPVVIGLWLAYYAFSMLFFG